ncbi:hypothetical protein PR002_g7004 [Phytophthora rubi]|uniref:Uncharacterized protein n=1 Tax=Phytophthora rubi TaxID=129364 RepID=A0A6A3N4R4_9STRA|nr:hypothetical protein PR002_g7004 [Phytophthora rubi]
MSSSMTQYRRILTRGCEKRCIKNRAEATTTFLTGYMKMSKDCQRTSLITALATCSGLSEGGQGHRFTGARTRYSYVLPLVGSVYRTAFQTVFNVSNDTITRHRNQVKRGEFALPALPAHGNTGNKHAQFVDEEAMKAFILRLAETHADVVPVRFRYQKPGNGMTSRQSTTKEYLLLPAYFSWVMMLGCDDAVVRDLLKRGVAKTLSVEETAELWTSFKKPYPPPPNKEKKHDINKKVLQYVPPDLRCDALYIVSGDLDEEAVAATKRSRRQNASQGKKRGVETTTERNKRQTTTSEQQ